MNACLSFLNGIGLLGANEEFFSKKPRADTPWLIVAWIMNVLVLFLSPAEVLAAFPKADTDAL